MFFRLLDHLRKQPESKRHAVALAGATVITAAVLLVWLSVLTTQLTGTQGVQTEAGVRSGTGSFEEFIRNDASEVYDEAVRERLRGGTR